MKVKIKRNYQNCKEYSGELLLDIPEKDYVVGSIPEYWVTFEDGRTVGLNYCPPVVTKEREYV